jgi:hypothetical protein
MGKGMVGRVNELRAESRHDRHGMLSHVFTAPLQRSLGWRGFIAKSGGPGAAARE